MFVSPELQFRATLFAQMISHFATALAPYLKRIKLVGVALALVFLANFSWGQFLNSDGAKPHCTKHTNAMLHAGASDNNAHDCCPKRGKVPPDSPSCCKYPCYTQVVTQMPILLGDAAIAVGTSQELPLRARYDDRLVVGFSPPELRPPII